MSTDGRRLYRSRSNRMIGGVCGGLGEYTNLDATVVRLIAVVLAVVGFFVPAIVGYLILMVVVPEEPAPTPPPE